MNQNGKHANVAVVDTLENATRTAEATVFDDPNDPSLQPPKEVETKKRGSWKRKLIGWSFVLVLIGGGLVARQHGQEAEVGRQGGAGRRTGSGLRHRSHPLCRAAHGPGNSQSESDREATS